LKGIEIVEVSVEVVDFIGPEYWLHMAGLDIDLSRRQEKSVSQACGTFAGMGCGRLWTVLGCCATGSDKLC
jgi:hypothetical protein